jgi:hypothetical protein
MGTVIAGAVTAGSPGPDRIPTGPAGPAGAGQG